MDIAKSSNNTPVITAIIEASIEDVWKALREREKLARWFGWNYSGLEAEINEIYFTNVREEGVSDATRRRLAVNGGDTFILTAQDDKTALQLVRRPLDGTPEDNYYETITEGWISFIEQLRFMLEHQPISTRRTIVAHRKLERDATWRALGLPDARQGQSFAGSLEGHDLSGSVQFVTPQQIGLLIKNCGPGLLIIQFGENMQLLTIYTSDTEFFNSLSNEWKS